VLHRISAFALTLIACVNGYSEDPPAVVPPVDAGTTPEAAVVPTARVDGAPPPACKLSEPFTTPEVVDADVLELHDEGGLRAPDEHA